MTRGAIRRLGIASAIVAIALLGGGRRAAAQNEARAYPEVRADAIFGAGSVFQLGAGGAIALGYYARLALIGATGVDRVPGGYVRSERADLLMRFLLDPFRESRWGISAGGGISLRHDAAHPVVRPYLVVLLDVEGPRRNGFSPALQIGLGGGARVGVAFRRSTGPMR